MAGLKKAVWILGVSFVATGLAFNVVPRDHERKLTEDNVLDMLPVKVGRFTPVLKDGEKVSYRMDEGTYGLLKPWGICARVFVNGSESYDVVAIASNNKESFHDPNICFSAQGWQLSNQRLEYIESKSHGRIPVTLVDMEQHGDKRVAMYFFRLNQGYYGDMAKVKRDMLVYTLKNFGKKDEGAFIRIIPTGVVDVEKMKTFAGNWVDSANESSKGYY